MPSAPNPVSRFAPVPFGLLLDESVKPNNFGGLLVAQNLIYRRFGALAKRPGSTLYGAVAGAQPVISGKRYYRGRPSVISPQMIVQSGDALYSGNDGTGIFTAMTGGGLAAGSTPAFFAQNYDGNATNADIVVVAYGSGAPLKYSGSGGWSALSGSITNLFTGTNFFHEHVWFWGDPANPDTLFATDIGNPEGFVFMTANGGYQIGRGDGDPFIQNCTANGSTQYVLKQRSIYGVTGFSLYSGEYSFSVQPIVTGIGTTAPHSVAVLRGQLYFWSGQMAYRLAQGSSEPEPIGLPLMKTFAKAASGNQSVIRAAAGDFIIQTADGPLIYTGVYLLAIDTGTGYADTVCVYDADSSQRAGVPAWTTFTGLPIGAFIPWDGPGDKHLLYMGDALGTGKVSLFGGDPGGDQGNAITTLAITGRYDFGTPNQVKRFDKLYFDVEANATSFTVAVISDIGPTVPATVPTMSNTIGAIVGTAVVGTAVVGSDSTRIAQSIEQKIDPEASAYKVQFSIQEQSATSSWELEEIEVHFLEETYRS